MPSSASPWWHANRLLLLILVTLAAVAGIVYGVKYISSRGDRQSTAPPVISSEPYEPKFTKKKHPDKEEKGDKGKGKKKKEDEKANK